MMTYFQHKNLMIFFNKDISFDDIEAATNSLPTTVVNMLDEAEESMKPKSISIQEKLHSSRFLSFLAEKTLIVIWNASLLRN